VQIGAGNKRLAVLAGPERGLRIEIQASRPEVAPLNRIEEIRVLDHARTQGAAVWKERMRSDHDPVAARPQRREIAECPNVVGPGREIDEQDVASFNRALDTRNEDDALVACILDETRICQNPIVKRNGQRVEPKLSGAINQLVGVV
jgi:hypothetical protein